MKEKNTHLTDQNISHLSNETVPTPQADDAKTTDSELAGTSVETSDDDEVQFNFEC